MVCCPVEGKAVPAGTLGSTETPSLGSFDCRVVGIVQMGGFSRGTHIFCCTSCPSECQANQLVLVGWFFVVAFGHQCCFSSALRAVAVQFKPAIAGLSRLIR